MSHNIEYVQFANFLCEILSSPEKIKIKDYKNIIRKATCLPVPNNEENYYELIESGISLLFSNLVFLLGDSAKGKTFKNLKKLLNRNLKDLWNIWEKLFIKCCFIHYLSKLELTKKYNENLSIFNFHYNKLYNKCADCEKTSLMIPSNDRRSPFYIQSNIDAFIRLSNVTLMGCEGFVYAAAILKNVIVFERVYSYMREPACLRCQLLWIPSILCAAKLKRAEILTDIFRLMKKAYREIDYACTFVLLDAANYLGVKEIINYFHELNSPSRWDLLTPYNIFIDQYISEFTSEKDLVTPVRLEFRAFVGVFWPEYFKNHFEGQIKERSDKFSRKNLQLLLKNKNINDWYTALCFAQKTYMQELRSRIYDEFQRQFFPYDYLNEDNFLSEVISGNVSALIKKYQENISTLVLHKTQESLKDEGLNYKFLPFIDCLLSNHLSFLRDRENYYRWKNDSDFQTDFFTKAEKLLDNINPEALSDKEWDYFLNLLTTRINKNAVDFF